jgi:hypothetical protein
VIHPNPSRRPPPRCVVAHERLQPHRARTIQPRESAIDRQHGRLYLPALKRGLHIRPYVVHYHEQRRQRRILRSIDRQRPAPPKRNRVRHRVLLRLLLLHVPARLPLAEQHEIRVQPVEHRIRHDNSRRALDLQLDRVQSEPLIRQIVEPRPIRVHQRQNSVQRPQPRVHSRDPMHHPPAVQPRRHHTPRNVRHEPDRQPRIPRRLDARGRIRAAVAPA